jgi:hypothetical protein
MKNYILRQIILEQGIIYKRFSKLMKFIFCAIFFLSAQYSFSQTVISLQNQLSGMAPEAAQELSTLVYGLNPAIYLINNELTVNGEGAPVVTVSDAASIDMLYDENEQYNTVNLVKITISNPGEMPGAIYLDNMQSFTSLEYLLFVFEYDACGNQSESCLQSLLESIVEGENSTVIVMYVLTIPS